MEQAKLFANSQLFRLISGKKMQGQAPGLAAVHGYQYV
jgi:hypothetical protein